MEDIPVIAKTIDSMGARASIPVQAYIGLDWGKPSTWTESRHWIAESSGICFGHFFLYGVYEQDQRQRLSVFSLIKFLNIKSLNPFTGFSKRYFLP